MTQKRVRECQDGADHDVEAGQEDGEDVVVESDDVPELEDVEVLDQLPEEDLGDHAQVEGGPQEGRNVAATRRHAAAGQVVDERNPDNLGKHANKKLTSKRLQLFLSN